jgi:hypothetical protein
MRASSHISEARASGRVRAPFDGIKRVLLGGPATLSGDLLKAGTAILYGVQDVAKRHGELQIVTES